MVDKTESDLVQSIGSLQGFDGAFRLSFEDAINLSVLTHDVVAPHYLYLTGKVVEDTDAIARLLTKYFRKWQSTWSLVEKARAWLATQGSNGGC